MKLKEAFWNCREKIVDKWVDYTLSTYISSEFFKKEKNKFSNPIGGRVRDALDAIFLVLTGHNKDDDISVPLEQMMLLRSVQEFTPSQAVSPLNAVKHITREVLASDKETKELVGELYDFEFAVDLAVFKAFDLYMESRERLYQVRIHEIKSGTHILTDSKCPSQMLKDI